MGSLRFKIPCRIITNMMLLTSSARIHPPQQKVKRHFQFQFSDI